MQSQCNSIAWMQSNMQPRCNCNAGRLVNGYACKPKREDKQNQARRKLITEPVNEGVLGLQGCWDHPHDARHAALRRNKVVSGNSRDL